MSTDMFNNDLTKTDSFGTERTPTATTQTPMSVDEYNEQNLAHVGCVMARYNLSDEEWDAAPERLRQQLLRECAETDEPRDEGPLPENPQTIEDLRVALECEPLDSENRPILEQRLRDQEAGRAVAMVGRKGRALWHVHLYPSRANY